MSLILAEMVAGVGLFFLGLHLVSGNLHKTSSRRLRALIARVTGRFWPASLLGLVAGAVMQSTSAVTVILASMTASGLTTARQALPMVAWANVGTTLLVFIAVLDIRLGVLYLLGVSATAFAFSKDSRARTAWAVALGIALLFYGIHLMKSSSADLQGASWFQTFLTQARGSFVLAFAVGALLSFVTQSTTAVTLIAVTLVKAGMLGANETMMIIYGGNVGSTIARMILSSGLKGSSRQVGHFQDVFKISGATVFTGLFYLEQFGHVPLVKALVNGLSARLETQMAYVNLLFNLTTAVVFSCLLGPTARLLSRLWPGTETEDFAKVQYLHPQALEDAETALDLVEKEQARLVTRLPEYVNVLRSGEPGKRRVDYRTLHVAFVALHKEVESYCTALLHKQLPAKTYERLTNVQNRHEVIGFIEDNVFHLAETVDQGTRSSQLLELVQTFAEALDFILLTAGDATTTLDAAEAEPLGNLCADRGELMGRIRNLYLSGAQHLSTQDRSLLLNLTTQFDRIVWMVRRLALLLAQNRQFRADIARE
jgi:phosphate:Na+ symporter